MKTSETVNNRMRQALALLIPILDELSREGCHENLPFVVAEMELILKKNYKSLTRVGNTFYIPLIGDSGMEIIVNYLNKIPV